MVAIDFSSIYKYSEYDDESGERVFDEQRLKKEAPAGVLQLYERYREIKNEEKQTGRHIF